MIANLPQIAVCGLFCLGCALIALRRERRKARRPWTLPEWYAAMEQINDFIEQQRAQLERAEALREELYRVPVVLDECDEANRAAEDQPRAKGASA
jgi:hypothetical protein